MTFAPDYATSGRLYTYSTDAGGDIRVDLWQRSADPDVASPARTLVLRIEHSSRNNHNGGDLHFGPDGMLYISTGDGGGGDDPDGNGQTLIRAGTADEQSTALLGKLLRIAPGDGRRLRDPAGQPVRRPRGRPRRDLRLRPAQPVSLLVRPRAPATCCIGDVGQDDAEEVNYSATQGRGANFGWKCFEGTLAQRRDDPAVHAARPRPAGVRVRPRRLPVDHRRLRRPRPRPADPARAATSTPTTASARSARSCRARARATRRRASTWRTSRSRRSARTRAGASTSCSSRARCRGSIDGAASPCPAPPPPPPPPPPRRPRAADALDRRRRRRRRARAPRPLPDRRAPHERRLRAVRAGCASRRRSGRR